MWGLAHPMAMGIPAQSTEAAACLKRALEAKLKSAGQDQSSSAGLKAAIELTDAFIRCPGGTDEELQCLKGKVVAAIATARRASASQRLPGPQGSHSLGPQLGVSSSRGRSAGQSAEPMNSIGGAHCSTASANGTANGTTKRIASASGRPDRVALSGPDASASVDLSIPRHLLARHVRSLPSAFSEITRLKDEHTREELDAQRSAQQQQKIAFRSYLDQQVRARARETAAQRERRLQEAAEREAMEALAREQEEEKKRTDMEKFLNEKKEWAAQVESVRKRNEDAKAAETAAAAVILKAAKDALKEQEETEERKRRERLAIQKAAAKENIKAQRQREQAAAEERVRTMAMQRDYERALDQKEAERAAQVGKRLARQQQLLARAEIAYQLTGLARAKEVAARSEKEQKEHGAKLELDHQQRRELKWRRRQELVEALNSQVQERQAVREAEKREKEGEHALLKKEEIQERRRRAEAERVRLEQERAYAAVLVEQSRQQLVANVKCWNDAMSPHEASVNHVLVDQGLKDSAAHRRAFTALWAL